MAAVYECGEELVPGYRVVKCLGRGGFGTVYKALGPGGFYVALKVINLAGGNEGKKELRALNLIKNVGHANLVRIMGAWLKDRGGLVVDDLDRMTARHPAVTAPPSINDTAIITPKFRPSELIICMTLGDRSLHDCLELRQREGRPGIPVEELFEYMEGAARGIDFLNREIHDMGDGRLVAIQHCDIKPMNILIVGGDSVQVCDFGMAKVVGDLRQSTGGAPLYMAPEVIRNREPSRSTDQYSLAVAYYELRTGAWPFPEDIQDSREGILQAHLEGKLDLGHLEPGERKVIAKATSVDPAQRYPTCLDMVRALREAHSQSSGGTQTRPQLLASGKEAPGEQFVPGYWLVERLDDDDSERVWQAFFNEDSAAAILVRDLPPSSKAFDRNALKLVLNRRSGFQLTVPNQYWLLGADGQEMRRSGGSQRSSDGMKGTATAAQLATKLVISGSLGDGTLQDRLRDLQKPFSFDVLLSWMEQIAEALDHLNSPRYSLGNRKVSIAHCNVRPASILCVEDGSDVLLGNFTRARVIEDAGDLSDIADDFPAPYAPPEILEGRIDRSSDQYGLAVMYLQLRTGQAKLPNLAAADDLLDGAREQLEPDEHAVVAKALSRDPLQRYPQCSEFVDALREALFQMEADEPTFEPTFEPPLTPPPAPVQETPPPKRISRDTARDMAVSTDPEEPAFIPASQKWSVGAEPVHGYRLIQLLGAGGFGEVWKATGPGGTEVALKHIMLDGKKGLKEFSSLRLVKLVRHPNLVPIVAYWLTDLTGRVLAAGEGFEKVLISESHASVPESTTVGSHSSQARPAGLIIAMGLGDRSLADRLEECRDSSLPGIPFGELIEYMDGAAQAIDFLNSPRHDLGSGPIAIQHCDIKPHNLLIVGGAVQVCDFGLARTVTNTRVTTENLSAAYGAPETWRGQSPHSTTDQYSLAISYYELRTNELPFEDSSYVVMMYSHIEGRLDFQHLPEAERQVIKRATSLAPEDRFESCRAMVAALRQAQHPVAPPPVTPPTPPRWPMIAAAIAAIAIGAGGLWQSGLLLGRPQPTPATTTTAKGQDPVTRIETGDVDPIVTPVPEVIDTLTPQVDEAETKLSQATTADEYRTALQLFNTLQSNPELTDRLQFRVLLGMARVEARLGLWSDVGLHLDKLESLGTERASYAAVLKSLRVLKNVAEIVETDAAKRLTAVIERLQQLMIVPEGSPASPPRDALTSLNSTDWEAVQIKTLRDQTVDGALQLASTVPANLDLGQRKARTIDDAAILSKLVQAVPTAKTGVLGIQLDLEILQTAYQEAEAALASGAPGIDAASDPRTVAVEQLALKIDGNRFSPPESTFVCGLLAKHAETLAATDQPLAHAILDLLYVASPKDGDVAKDLESLVRHQLKLLRDQSDDLAVRPQLATECRRAIEAGIADPYIQTCWAECLLHWPPEDLRSQSIGVQVENALPKESPESEETYWRYVRTCALRDATIRPDWTVIRDQLSAIEPLVSSSERPVLLTSLRQQKLGEMFFETAEQTWFPPAKVPRSIEDAAKDPYGLVTDRVGAAKASEWLATARRLAPQVETKPDFGLYATIAGAIRGESPPPVTGDTPVLPVSSPTGLNYKNIAVRLLLTGSQPGKDASDLKAVSGYHALSLELLAVASSTEDLRQVYDHVLDRGIQLGTEQAARGSSPELASKLSEMLAAKGQYLWVHRFDQSVPDVHRQMASAYDQAIKLLEAHPGTRDADIPSYICRWGQARFDIPNATFAPADLNEIIERARRAASLFEQSHGGEKLLLANGLVGQGHRLLSDHEPNLNRRAGLLQSAVAELEAATATNPVTDTEDTAWSLMNLVQARINQVHILPYDLDRYTTILHKAIADAARAVKCSQLYPEYAYTSLGNACEDTAWLVGFVNRAETVKYDEAIAAFTESADRNPLLRSNGLCARGRSYVKRYLYSGKRDRADLDAAEADFKAAVDDPLAPSSEAAYWLCQVALVQRDIGGAEAYLQKSRDLTVNGGGATHWSTWAALPLSRAQLELRQPDGPARIKQIYASAAADIRTRAAGLEKQPRLSGTYEEPAFLAALLVGQSYEIEGNWTEALGKYEAALGATPREQLDATAANLLLRRCKALSMVKPKDWQSVARLDAQRLVELQPFPWDRATALGLLAHLEQQTGDPSQRANAIQHFRQFINLVPKREDGSIYETAEYPGWQARLQLILLLYPDLVSTTLPVQHKQAIFTEAVKLCEEAIGCGGVPDQNKLTLTTLKQRLEVFRPQLFPAAAPQAAPVAVRK